MSYVYNGKFTGNILVVGRTGCEKTGFVQKLAVNKLFGDLVKAEWVSYIKPDKQREAELQSCFDSQLDFYYPRSREQFEELLEYFKAKSSSAEPGDTHSDQDFSSDVVNYGEYYGEKIQRNCLIVMDDVSGLADLSVKFASFLTVARKFKYHCLYIFPRSIHIFPASVPIGTVKKVLEANCIRKTNRYIPVNSLWVTKLFIKLANNESEKTYLTIDCTGFNPNGPGRFRTDAANPETQTCFFNKADEDTLFNVKRIKKDTDPNKILFEIEGLKTQADNETYSASLELENLQGNGLSNVRNAEGITNSEYENIDVRGKRRSKWKSVRPKFLPG